jgi:hypothetical protein
VPIVARTPGGRDVAVGDAHRAELALDHRGGAKLRPLKLGVAMQLAAEIHDVPRVASRA